MSEEQKPDEQYAVTHPASTRKTSVVARMADRFGVDQTKMLDCLKATAFKGGASNEQLMALCIVAEQYKLNPWTKEIFAFPDKQNGIVPVVGVDGWSRIINEHPQFDGMEFAQDDQQCTCTIHRKDRAHPISATEYMDECKRNTSPWTSHPRRMLRHKALIQAARLAFGYSGIYDQDEAERIIEAQAVTVSPARPQTAKRGASPLAAVVVPVDTEKPPEQAQTADGDGDTGIDADVEAVL
jgi:phage recombination protein Bet